MAEMTPREAWYNIQARLEYARKCYRATYGGSGRFDVDDEADILAFKALLKLEEENNSIQNVEINIFDSEEIHYPCTVQILHNSVTGQQSIGWWEGSPEEKLPSYDEVD